MKYIFTLIITIISLNASVIDDASNVMREFYPHGKISQKSIFLTKLQKQNLENKAKQKLDKKVYYYFTAINGNQTLGYGFLLNSKVRSKNVVALYVISNEKSIKAIEILRFYEPKTYLPRDKWFVQFRDKSTKDELKIKHDISNITGATFSARAVSKQAKLALGLLDEIHPHK